jgi:hypothetical protein
MKQMNEFKWQFKDGTPYTGGTHVLAGRVFSGKTRTAASMPLVQVEEESEPQEKPKRVRSSQPKPRKKQPPKPKGATAWD